MVVNCTSASGGSLSTLQKPKRVVITATKTGTEKNATVFARFFIEALRDPAADTDKNESISVLEAFRYAEEKTGKYFETQKRLATEHALIEDTGKGEGVKAPSAENGEGLIAGRQVLLHLGSVASIVNDPEKQKLLKRKDELETQIDELKYRKAAIPQREYQQQMRQLLLDLANVQAGAGQMKLQTPDCKRPVWGRGALGGLVPGPAGRTVPREAGRGANAVSASDRSARTLRKHGDPGTKACYQKLSTSNDLAIKAEGLWGLRDYQGANNAFQAAVKARPKDANLKVRWGLMFNEYSQPGDAEDLFKEALDDRPEQRQGSVRHGAGGEPSLRGRRRGACRKSAEGRSENGAKRASCWRASRSKTIIPKRPSKKPRRRSISRAKLWTRFRSWRRSTGWTTSPARNGSTRFSRSIRPMGKPTPPAGHFFVINRRYDEGIQYYRKALEIKPDLWSARAELGVNLMRLGQNAEARQDLEACFNANYSSPLVRNTLKLLDSIDKNVVTFTTPTTILKLDKKEATFLRPYFQAELDRAMATYEKRYHYKITGHGAAGSLSQPSGFRSSHHGVAGIGRAGRDLRPGGRDGFAERASAGPVPLGQHAVARVQPRVRSLDDE